MESGYNLVKFKEVLEQSKEYLLRLNDEKGSEIIREVLKNPNFDDTDVYYLTMIEIQDPSYKLPHFVVPKKPHYDESDVYLCLNEHHTQFVLNPPERNTPLKIRFVMSGSKPAKPICEEENPAKKTEKTGRKRPRGSSYCDSDEEEEKERVVQNQTNKKKKVQNNLVQRRKVGLPEIRPDLPDGMKEIIRNLEGTQVNFVIQKKLTSTDLSSRHRRLSLPRGQLIDKDFLGGKDVALIEAHLVGENGKTREIDIRQWSMSKGIYNVVKGWIEVVGDHELCQDLVVQLWSFRVEENLWFALVKLWKVKKLD